jgi:hypothetical protein
MENKFAGQSANQSGQRFLDSSAPRLIRHAESCETAGGEFVSSSAGKDQKLSREFEGRALIGAEGAVLSSLDKKTNNRNTGADLSAVPVGRGKHCGRFSIKGWDSRQNKICYRRVNCGSWTCSYCGPRKAKRAKRAIRDLAETLGLCYFLTLTIDPSHLREGEDPIKHLQVSFDKFRTYLRRKFGETPVYIRVVEFTQKGLPHYHILTDRYIEQQWISRTWNRLGGGKIVWIRRARIRKIAHYLAKYLTKELLLSAPKGTRRITTARAVKLFPKFHSEIVWEMLRSSIWFLHKRVSQTVIEIQGIEMDEENYLKAFSIPAPNISNREPGIAQRRASRMQIPSQGVAV